MGRNEKKSKEQKSKKHNKNGKFLDHGTVVLNTINQKLSIHNTIYTWRVPKYSKLKRNVMYYQEFDSKKVKCVFKLFKTNNVLYLCLRSEKLAKKQAQFYLMSEINQTPLTSEATEIREGLFSGEFKYELFEDPKLEFLVDDMLTVSFRYMSDIVRDFQESDFNGADILSDLDELCCDLKRMYLDSMYPDFEMKVKDYVFKTHKFILSARCDFFKAFFDENPDAEEFTVDTEPGILHEVLLYVYSGELNDMDDMKCVLKMVDLADYLGIESLIKKCAEIYCKSIPVGESISE